MTILRVKPGVRLFGLKTEMLWAADRGVDVWSKHGIAYFTITSARGDKHGDGSYHPLGLAIDVRRRGLAMTKVEAMVTDLKDVLGPDYDVIIEFKPPHIHIEYQPKEAYAYLTLLAA